MSAHVPRVSVIIPAFHSDLTIGACLKALRAQTYRDFETIIVNSSPEEVTRQIVAEQSPENIFKQSEIRLLPHAARNLGVSIARGQLFAFTDPDCIPRPNWLTELVHATEEGHAVVQGSVDLVGKSWRASAVYFCKRYTLLSGLPAYSPWIVSTINACYTRQAWDAAGPFDGELFCADALLSWRARELGYHARFVPQAIVGDTPGESAAELFRQRFERGMEFAGARAGYEHWSRWRAAGYALAFPLILIVILSQAFRNALTVRQSLAFVLTLPMQLIGHLGWLFGESSALLWSVILPPKTIQADPTKRNALLKNAAVYRSDS